MVTCIVCRFATVEDDVAFRAGVGRCVCLACYLRETGFVRPMPRRLRREIVTVLTAIGSSVGDDVAA